MLNALALAGAIQQDPRAEVVRVTPAFTSAAAPGCFNRLAVDPFDPNVLFGYSHAPGDLHRSDDGGLTWIDLAGPPQFIQSVAFSRIDPARVFAVAAGFYVSEDRGETWARSLSAPPDLAGELVLDPFSPLQFYVASSSFRGGTNVGEMWFSPDEGVHWVRKESGLPIGVPRSSLAGLVASPQEPGVLLVLAPDGVYGTHDGGDRWERLSAEAVFPVGFDADSPSVVWGRSGDSVVLSADGGMTWQPITVDDCCPEATKSLLAFEPDPLSPGVAYAIIERSFPYFFWADVVLRTVDYGATWQFAGDGIDGILPAQLRDLAFSADGRVVWVTDCGKVAVYRRELRRARAIAPR
jgi:photosystem II stability/assembly factor-like uncharacterized protein